MRKLRVLVAGDRALVRDGIRAMLEKLSGLQLVAEANNGDEAIRLINRHQPDVALIESGMSRLDAFQVTARVRKDCPRVRVVVLSTQANDEYLKQAMDCGAAGYLTMTVSARELETAIRTVASGKPHFSRNAESPPEDILSSRAGNELLERLTPRQCEVLKLTAEGKSTRQIAEALKISTKTVETHRTLLSQRLGIHHTAGLVRYAIKAGLIRLED